MNDKFRSAWVLTKTLPRKVKRKLTNNHQLARSLYTIAYLLSVFMVTFALTFSVTLALIIITGWVFIGAVAGALLGYVISIPVNNYLGYLHQKLILRSQGAELAEAFANKPDPYPYVDAITVEVIVL